MRNLFDFLRVKRGSRTQVEFTIENVPFCTINWSAITPTQHPGVTGEAYWRTFEIGNIRVRMVEYTPGYKADHWCPRGHVLLVLEGELVTELEDGREFTLPWEPRKAVFFPRRYPEWV